MSDDGPGIDTGRFGRILALIAFVTTVFLLTSAETLGDEGDLLPIAAVAIGSIAFVTAIVGGLIAFASAYEEGGAR